MLFQLIRKWILLFLVEITNVKWYPILSCYGVVKLNVIFYIVCLKWKEESSNTSDLLFVNYKDNIFS